jgi:hypothetical protein
VSSTKRNGTVLALSLVLLVAIAFAAAAPMLQTSMGILPRKHLSQQASFNP